MVSAREFEAFGPWIDQVRTADELPRLYRDAGIEPAACRLVLKVPRAIERRNATPDMHLYDHLIAVEPETLAVLTRYGDGYRVTRLPLDRIVAIEDGARLLDGLLTLHTADGPPITLPYNGSSRPRIQDLVGTLRQTYLPIGPDPAWVIDPQDLYLGPADASLVTAYRTIVAREPAMRLICAAPRREVAGGGLLPRPETLHAAIVLTDDREILVVHRRDWFTRRGDNLSQAEMVVPRSRITAGGVERHPRYRGVSLVTLQCGGSHLRFPFTDGPELYAFLAVLGLA